MVLLAGLDHELHHDQGADGDDFVVLVAGGDQLFQGGGDHALLAVAAVVGHHPQLVAAGGKVILQDQQVLAAEADDAVDHAALLVQLAGNGQGNGAAHAAAHHADLFQTLGLGGAAQGAHKIMDFVTHLQGVQLHGGVAHDLEDDVHRAGLPVVAGDGQGDALALLQRADDDELARLRLLGDQGRLDAELGHSRVQLDLLRDPVHGENSFIYDSLGWLHSHGDVSPCQLGCIGKRPNAAPFCQKEASAPSWRMVRHFGLLRCTSTLIIQCFA